MRTQNLDRLYQDAADGCVVPTEMRVRAAVAEDIRSACEEAWDEGKESFSMAENPYKRKAGT